MSGMVRTNGSPTNLPVKLNPLFHLQDSEKSVLRCIWAEGAIPRIDIGKRTGLGSATVTRITRELSRRGLVQESVRRSGRRGKPARPVTLRQRGAFAYGVYFSHSYMDVGLIDLTGRLIAQERLPFDQATPSLIARTARIGLTRLTASTGVELARVVGAGFALPGDFGESGKLKAHAYFPALMDCDAMAVFSESMPIPVFVENDGTAAAAGERVNGVGRSIQTFVFIHIGHGVGGGLVLSGRLFRGHHGNSGLMGGLFALNAPRPSGQDLIETLQAAGYKVPDFNFLDDPAILDSPVMRKWIGRAGRQLGQALSVGGRLIDPEAIILGGRMPPKILNALFAALDVKGAFAASQSLPPPAVLASELGPDGGLIGAASVCMLKTFFEW
jgi:predicted NBD/HSP70 family sugar kinase